jgi:magnesium transporter
VAAPEETRATETPSVEMLVEEELYGPSEELLAAMREALRAGNAKGLESLLSPLHPADVADLIEHLEPAERESFLEKAGGLLDPETLSHLEEALRDEVVERMAPAKLAAVVSELDTDDAVDLLEDLDEETQQRVLSSVSPEDRVGIELGLNFPEDSAGRLMQRELVAVPKRWTVGETIDYLRAAKELPDDFYDLYVIDTDHKPVGSVTLSRAMRSPRATRLTDIMNEELRLVPADMDQEAVAYLFRQYGLVSAPVVDAGGKIIGVITVDDVVRVIDEEAEEDLLAIVGVSDTDFHASALRIAFQRVRWLVVTLINTLIASLVISRFEDTIGQYPSLAVLMPITAAMGGNAGVQVITVTIRALATREITPSSNIARLIGKELLVGLMNAFVFAAILGTLGALWFGHAALGLVLGAAMVFNMVWAGFAGTIIPLALDRLGFDPATGAGPFLTTTTDCLGFFAFLGLATLFLT